MSGELEGAHPDLLPESELHALIRHRCDFGLAEKQNEVDALKIENRKLRATAQRQRRNDTRRKRRRLKRRKRADVADEPRSVANGA